MTIELKTSRGAYALALAREPERLPDALVVTLSLERRDGIERLALRYRIAASLLGADATPESVVARLAPWIERQFEMTREFALKAIRSEHQLLEIAFDESNRGPFQPPRS